MSDIAKRLRVSAKYNSFNGGFYERSIVKSQMEEAADYIEQLERDLIETRAELERINANRDYWMTSCLQVILK